MATFPFTGDPLSQIEVIYIGYFARAGDSTGTNFWISQFLAQGSTQAALNQIAGEFSQTPEAKAEYPFLASPLTASQAQITAFINQVYQNLFGRNSDPAGLAFWQGQINAALATMNPTVIAAQLGVFIENVALGATGFDQTNLAAKVTVGDYFTQHVDFTSSPLALEFAHDVVASVHTPADIASAEAITDTFVANPPSDHTFTLTTAQDSFTGTGHDIFNAPLSGILHNQATLTAGDSLVETGITTNFPGYHGPGTMGVGPGTHSFQNAFFSAVLNATFLQDHDYTARSLNIVNIPVWNIDLAGTGDGTVTLTGDAAGGPNVISGLMELNVNFDEGTGCLVIGDNSSPVLDPNGAFNLATGGTAFTINVSEATGDGYFGPRSSGPSPGYGGSNPVLDGGYYEFRSPCVDVDIAASAFTGHDTINVTANIVGGFPQYNGSYIVPPEIYVAPDDGDDYDPSWLGYLSDAFSISAGASAGNLNPALGPLGGAVGFQNWVVASTGAIGVGTLNIIALGGEGSSSAQTITLTDDGSNTILFATAVSDALSTDWKNVQTVSLGGTRGFVTLTGLETNVQEVGIEEGLSGQNRFTPSAFLGAFQIYDGGGLLASDTAALIQIFGGSGNSFYDLSSLTPAAAHAALGFDGGHSTAGNSEVSFNNAVFNSNLSVHISNIQILDDVSSIGAITVSTNLVGTTTAVLENDGEAQGGIINMANFALAPLNVNYALLAEDLQFNGGIGAPVPYGLPYTLVQGLFAYTPQQIAVLTANLPPAVTLAEATDFLNGVVPAGFPLLQFLNAEGSTQCVLGANLLLYNDPINFAVNMQDLADGMRTDLTDGDFVYGSVWSGFNMSFSTAPNSTGTLILFVSDDGVVLNEYFTTSESDIGYLDPGYMVQGQALYVPVFSSDNEPTINIVLPTESAILSGYNPLGGGRVFVDNQVIIGASLNAANGNSGLAGAFGANSEASFADFPVSLNAAVFNTVNFFDNHADNGGSPPGFEDSLVLGDTNFTDTLVPIAGMYDRLAPGDGGWLLDPNPAGFFFPAAIGVTSVAIDAVTSSNLAIAATEINDFASGSFEIGATNVTLLQAHLAASLTMDLPATLDYIGNFSEYGPLATGITVFGSDIGQNLLQGTSGTVHYDLNGHLAPIFPGIPGIINLGVLEADVQQNGSNGGWGGDTLWGGDGFGHLITTNVSGAISQTFILGVANWGIDGVTADTTGGTTGPGNHGDNFFPEGGNDVVNIAAGEVGTLTSYQDVEDSSGTVLIASLGKYDNQSTVWVGFYDVCNSGGSDFGNIPGFGYLQDTGVGTIYEQAITDIIGGVEVFVDGYGASGQAANLATSTSSAPVVTINGFHIASAGDTVVFGSSDWATGTSLPSVGGVTAVDGLVNSDGHTPIHLGFATYADVGTGGAVASVTGTLGGAPVSVVLDTIGGSYISAADLQNALSHHSTSFVLADITGVALGHESDILVAYQLTNGQIAIADVTLTNTGTVLVPGLPPIPGPLDVAQLHPVVHDLVHINPVGGTLTTGVANLFAHNIDIVA